VTRQELGRCRLTASTAAPRSRGTAVAAQEVVSATRLVQEPQAAEVVLEAAGGLAQVIGASPQGGALIDAHPVTELAVLLRGGGVRHRGGDQRACHEQRQREDHQPYLLHPEFHTGSSFEWAGRRGPARHYTTSEKGRRKRSGARALAFASDRRV